MCGRTPCGERASLSYPSVLLELGTGFAFVGSQYHIEFDEEDYFLDLLFYHLKLRCYVIIISKTESSSPSTSAR
jgi:predicted nuclease of restriction endonuclease-like (RecB) superfamily